MLFGYYEKDFEDYLWNNPQAAAPLGITRWTHRQLALPSGRLDLMGLNADGVPCIVELKMGFSSGGLLQLARYSRDIQFAIGFYYSKALYQPRVNKYFVARGKPTSKPLFEAAALGVRCHSWNDELKIESEWVFTREYAEKTNDWWCELSDLIGKDCIGALSSDDIQAVKNGGA